MNEIKEIKIEDFDYSLPDGRIALHPLQKRDECKLLVSDHDGTIYHHIFKELPELIERNSLIVANETKVINARMEFFKESGSRIEIFLLEPVSPADYALCFAERRKCTWGCMVGNRKRWKEGPLKKALTIDGKEVTLTAKLGNEMPGNAWEVTFEWDHPQHAFATIVEAAGEIPIPPYLKRRSEKSDLDDYQTIYSRTEGSVAAPTAGLHFTPELMKQLKEREIEMANVTLHVGAGTFQPVKSEKIGDHPMHSENIIVERPLIARIIRSLEKGETLTAVGTTTVRTLESLPYIGWKIQNRPDIAEEELGVEQWLPYSEETSNISTIEALQSIIDYLDRHQTDQLSASTSIMIAPGFRWRIIDRLITNFHQPKSTLLLLVSSFLNPVEASGSQWKKIYNEALECNYRFLSYGDACLLEHIY